MNGTNSTIETGQPAVGIKSRVSQVKRNKDIISSVTQQIQLNSSGSNQLLNIKVPKSSRTKTKANDKEAKLEIWKDGGVNHTQPNDSYIGSDVADEFEYVYDPKYSENLLKAQRLFSPQPKPSAKFSKRERNASTKRKSTRQTTETSRHEPYEIENLKYG